MDPAKDLLAAACRRSTVHVLLDDVLSHVGRIFVLGGLRFTILGRLLGCGRGCGILGPGGCGIRKTHFGKAISRWC